MDIFEWNQKFRLEFLVVNQVKTAIFITDFSEERQTLLLLHGISGSHFGLKFLTESLFERYNLILVDLPGHGESSIPEDSLIFDLIELKKWLSELVELLQRKLASSQLMIITHSFACYAVSEELSKKFEVMFICPVPSPSRWSKYVLSYSSLFLLFSGATRLYNSFAFSKWRGLQLLQERGGENERRMAFIASQDAQTTVNQRRFQFRLSRSWVPHVFNKIRPKLVVLGKFDQVAMEQLSEFRCLFPESELLEIPTGHLPVVEGVELLTEIVDRNFCEIII